MDNTPENVSGAQEVAKPKKRGIPANCRHGRDESRFKIAESLVEAGETPTRAMVKAGYSKNTVKHSDYPVKKALIKVRDNFMMAYVKNLKKKGLDGETISNRLAKTINGKDDQNSTQAIKTHVMIMLKNAPQGDQASGFLGVFVVPAPKDPATWQKEAQNLRPVQVHDMIQDAVIVENGQGVTTQ